MTHHLSQGRGATSSVTRHCPLSCEGRPWAGALLTAPPAPRKERSRQTLTVMQAEVGRNVLGTPSENPSLFPSSNAPGMHLPH